MVNNLKQHCAIFRVFQNRVTNIPSAATIRNASKKYLYTNYPVHVCAAGLCIWSRWFVYMCMCGKKNWLFEVLPLGKLPLVQSTACSSSFTAKKGAYYAR